MITGEAKRGETLTASAGTWSGTPTISHSYQWRSCHADTGDCIDIPGAGGQTFVPTSDQVARRVRVAVTATNAGGSASAESAPSNVVVDSDAGGGGGGGGGVGGGAPGAPGGGAPPNNKFSITGARVVSSNGRAIITVDVPGPGILSLLATSQPGTASQARAAAKKITVARVLRNVTRGGRVKLTIKPSRKARAILKRKRRLKVGVRIKYTPSGGSPSTRTRNVTLKLKRRR